MTDPIQAEQRLAQALKSGNESLVAEELAAIGRDSIEFTGRCYTLAITGGLVETTLLFGRAGFHLNVMDEPAVQAELERSGNVTRGLVDFMQRYRSCKAQRTYYLPIVQAPASIEPIRALLREGVGLTQRDCSELLSLAVRQDNTDLARVLVEGGARLASDIHDAAPDDLAGKMALSTPDNPWLDQLSPRSSMQTIAFVLEQLGNTPCPIRADWFKLYFRDPQFSAKLALIAPHSSADACENASALLAELARGGHVEAVRAVLSWNGIEPDQLDEALPIAQEAGHVEITAALLRAKQANASAIEPLAF